MSNRIDYRDDAKQQMLKGIIKLCDAVSVTLGPMGRNVVINKKNSILPHITKDGVTVAKSIILPDPVENTGSELLKSIAQQTVNDAGDGTTTATILGKEIYEKGLNIVTEGRNAIEVKRGIDKAVEDVCKILKDSAKIINGPEDVFNIAKISSNGDDFIAGLIRDAYKEVGNDGVITVKDSPFDSEETYIKVNKGTEILSGYWSEHFINQKTRRTVEFDEPYILVSTDPLRDWHDLLPIIQEIASKNLSLVIIAEDYSDEIVSTLIANIEHKAINVCILKTPQRGTAKIDTLKDLCIMTNAKLIRRSEGRTLQDFGNSLDLDSSFLGRCKSFTADKEKSIFIEGWGDDDVIATRIKDLKASIIEEEDKMKQEVLKSRLANVSNSVAVMYIGGKTDAEHTELKDRIDDALNASKAAIDEGILPGGGRAYLWAFTKINNAQNQYYPDNESQDYISGYKLLVESLPVIFMTILENAGIREKEEILRKILESELNFGYDARKGQITDMIASGIIDPTKVEVMALKNAASVSGLLLTTEAVITELPDEDNSIKLIRKQ